MNHSLFNQISEVVIQNKKLPIVLSSITLIGADSFRYLNGQITNDLKILDDLDHMSACVLDNAGKIVSNFYIKKIENGYSVICLADFVDITLKRLDQYLIADDVDLQKSDSTFEIVLCSKEKSRAFSLPAKLLNTKDCSDFEIISDELFNRIVYNSGESLAVDQIQNFLLNDTVYMETSTSLKTGCFLGQETVAKIETRRGSAKKWSSLEAEANLELIDSMTINSRPVKVLAQINCNKRTYFEVPLGREYRIEGRSIDVEISQKIYKMKYKSFPLINWTLDSWADESYLEAVELFHQNKSEEAISLLNLIIKNKPDFEDAYESIAVILGREENYEDAIKYLKQLEEINPDSVLVHTNLSLNYMKLGQIELAEEHKSHATIKTFESFGKEAQVKREKEQRARAEEEENLKRESMFKEVLEIDELDALANYGMGDIKALKKEFKIAQKHLEVAISTDPKYSQAYLRLAEVLVELKEVGKAKSVLEKGIQVAATHGNLIPANKMQILLDQI